MAPGASSAASASGAAMIDDHPQMRRFTRVRSAPGRRSAREPPMAVPAMPVTTRMPPNASVAVAWLKPCLRMRNCTAKAAKPPSANVCAT